MGMNPVGRAREEQAAVTPCEVAVQCEATPEQLGSVHEALNQFWSGVAPAPPDDWRMMFELAVSEVAANIVEHARPPFMSLRLSAMAGKVVAEFMDGGRGWSGPPSPSRLVDELSERGRGLALARTAVDEVMYERDGPVNRWRLIKWL